MDMLFDLQMFAEDATEETNAEVTEATAAEAPEEPAEEIPEELDGVSEEVAREVMQEAEAKEQEERETESASADRDSVNKPVDATKSGQKIPYQRFKQQVDKANDLEAQLAAYRQKFGDINSAPQQQAAQQPAQQQEPPQQPKQMQGQQMQLTPEVAKQIQSVIRQRAMQLTNMTEDDVESLEYAEDDDQRIKSWQSALKLAESDVYAGIRQAQAKRAQEVQRMVQEHEASVKAFNDFAQKQMEAPDFDKIQKYACDSEHGYPSKLSESERHVIDEAYQRIRRNTASPMDIYAIKTYYEQAKADYYNQKAAPARRTTTSSQKAHPRSEQIRGAVSPDGSVTAEQLKDMLMTKDWNDIPEKYRNLMKGL